MLPAQLLELLREWRRPIGRWRGAALANGYIDPMLFLVFPVPKECAGTAYQVLQRPIALCFTGPITSAIMPAR
jgi:hypothetical protein